MPHDVRTTSASKRVLVVDDNVDCGDLLVTLLELWGHEATHVLDGPSALQAAVARPPSLILMDIGLPATNGFELAEQLRRLLPESQARIVFVSGYDVRPLADASTLVKPIDLDALAALLAD